MFLGGLVIAYHTRMIFNQSDTSIQNMLVKQFNETLQYYYMLNDEDAFRLVTRASVTGRRTSYSDSCFASAYHIIGSAPDFSIFDKKLVISTHAEMTNAALNNMPYDIFVEHGSKFYIEKLTKPHHIHGKNLVIVTGTNDLTNLTVSANTLEVHSLPRKYVEHKTRIVGLKLINTGALEIRYSTQFPVPIEHEDLQIEYDDNLKVIDLVSPATGKLKQSASSNDQDLVMYRSGALESPIVSDIYKRYIKALVQNVKGPRTSTLLCDAWPGWFGIMSK